MFFLLWYIPYIIQMKYFNILKGESRCPVQFICGIEIPDFIRYKFSLTDGNSSIKTDTFCLPEAFWRLSLSHLHPPRIVANISETSLLFSK